MNLFLPVIEVISVVSRLVIDPLSVGVGGNGVKFRVTVTVAQNSINCRCNWHVCPPQWQ